jgi:hypothetical protein
VVREFAITQLDRPEYQRYSIEMLARNYEPGDEQRIRAAITLPDDECERHWLLMSLLKFIEQRPEAESEASGELIYEHTPCSQCRYSVVTLMNNRKNLPERFREECQYDVVADTRSQVGGPTWNVLAI